MIPPSKAYTPRMAPPLSRDLGAEVMPTWYAEPNGCDLKCDRRRPLTSAKKQFTVGPLSEFPPGQCRIHDIGGKSIGIYNRDGELYAVRNLCPHKLAPICYGTIGGTFLPSKQGEWVYGLDGYVLRCVAHAWEFDIRTGESVMMVDRRRLATYPVSVEGDQVVVTMRVSERDDAREEEGRLAPAASPEADT